MDYSNIFQREKQKEHQELKKLQNEEEIEQQLEEKLKLERMEEQIKKMKMDYEKARMQNQYQQMARIDDQKNKLTNRLEQILTSQKSDHFENKIQIARRQREIEKIQQEENEKKKQMMEQRKINELEKIVRAKLELEKIAEQKKSLENDFTQVNKFISVVNEEKEKRDINSKLILQRALQRATKMDAEILNNALTEKDQILLSQLPQIIIFKANIYLNREIKSEQEKQRILDNIQDYKKKQCAKFSFDAQEKIKQLNEYRFEMLEYKEKLIKTKAEYGELQKKGDNFLTELELGNAPPQEYIIKNLQIDYDQYRADEPDLQTILQLGKQYVQTAPKKIDFLRQDLTKDEANVLALDKQRQYTDFYLRQANPQSVQIARSIIMELVDDIETKIVHHERELNKIKEQKDYFEHKQQVLGKQLEQEADKAALRMIAQELATKVANDLALQAATETASANVLAKKQALQLLFKAIIQEKNPQANENQLYNEFCSLREPNLLKKQNQLRFNFVDRLKLSDGGAINKRRAGKKPSPPKGDKKGNKK